MTTADDVTVVGIRPRITRKSLTAMVVIGVAYLAWGLASRHYTVFVIYAGLALPQLWAVLRSPTVVSANGIRRPWCRRSLIDWAEVSSIAKPALGRSAVRLNLLNGKGVSLTDIAADRSASVAAIGGKQMAAAVALPRAAPPPPRPPTDEMRHAQALRQAASLSAGWKRLADESDRIHPLRTRTDPASPPPPG